MATTTLDPGQKSAQITLSGGNLVATSSGTGGVRANRPFTSLKQYFEATITTLTGAPAVGFVSQMWTNVFDLGSQNNTLGYHPLGTVTCNTTTLATIATYAQGNRIGCAFDFGLKQVWFRVNGGNWNNSGTADPTTGTGGIDFSASLTNPSTFLAAISCSLTGTVWTMNFSSPADAVPSGYSLIDVQGYSAVNATSKGAIPFSAALPAAYGVTAVPLPGSVTMPKTFNGTTITNVSGTTKENGATVTSKKVEVYDRVTGELLGSTYSDGSGNWSIPCLGRPAVRVVGSDPTTYNSQVYDNVVPV